jgi:hypothetical protein
MAESIVPKSQPKESNKSDLKLDSEICLNCSQRLAEPMDPRDPRYLTGIDGYLIRILDTTVSNLTRLHDDLSKIQEMLGEGGEL